MNAVDLATHERGVKAHTMSLAQMEMLSLQLIAYVRRFESVQEAARTRLMELQELHRSCDCPLGNLTEEDQQEIIDAILGPAEDG